MYSDQVGAAWGLAGCLFASLSSRQDKDSPLPAACLLGLSPGRLHPCCSCLWLALPACLPAEHPLPFLHCRAFSCVLPPPLPCRTAWPLCAASSPNTWSPTSAWGGGWREQTSSGETRGEGRGIGWGCCRAAQRRRRVQLASSGTGSWLPCAPSVCVRVPCLASLPVPALPRPCRYMVVLRHGGVYADLDSECRRPLDSLLHSGDTLVAGWDTEFPDAQAALDAG